MNLDRLAACWVGRFAGRNHDRKGVVGSLAPDSAEVLAGPPAQQQAPGTGQAVAGRIHGGVGRRPAALREAAAAVLIRPGPL